ncbi:MAG TPA: YciI family protein [Micromonosporaceae bacterium]|jgi:hypothetical protein|nr:YciI family protein [Micromonosporaceae bacterium]
MFIVELAFDGGPERLAARPAHRDLLRAWHAEGIVVMAGPYPDESGAVLIFNVPSEAALDDLLATDPYYTTTGVRVIRRREWTPLVS